MKKNKLHKIAPNLFKISSKQAGFEVPKQYFKSIEDVVCSEIELQKIKTTTSKFETPTNYFETFEEKVIHKLKTQKKEFSIKRIGKIMLPIAVAASLLLVFILNEKTTSFESLATSEIESFIENGIVDMNTESLSIAFSEIELNDENIDTSLTDDDVFDYLTTEDLETIIYDN